MKRVKMVYLAVGFLAGLVYLLHCGGATNSIADAIGSAIDVVFDNSSSSISATNVQAAIDEIASDLESLNAGLSVDILTGAWTGTQYYHGQAQPNVTITFNSDNSFSCSGGVAASVSALCSDEDSSCQSGLCNGSYTWAIKGNTILLTNTEDEEGYRVIKVDSIDGSNIGVYFSMEIPSQYDFFYGAKTN